MKRFQNFDLSKGDDVGICIDKEDFKACQDECDKSLVGKIHGDKHVSYLGFNIMTGL